MTKGYIVKSMLKLVILHVVGVVMCIVRPLIVQVRPDQSGQESGWMIGRLNGVDGCFPEAYVQLVDDAGTSSAVPMATEVKAEVAESTVNDRSDTCACFICYSQFSDGLWVALG